MSAFSVISSGIKNVVVSARPGKCAEVSSDLLHLLQRDRSVSWLKAETFNSDDIFWAGLISPDILKSEILIISGIEYCDESALRLLVELIGLRTIHGMSVANVNTVAIVTESPDCVRIQALKVVADMTHVAGI